MKKYLFVLSGVMLGLLSSAQVDNEAIFFTGGLSFVTADSESSIELLSIEEIEEGVITNAKQNDFSFSAGAGYMFTDELGAGLMLRFQNTWQTGEIEIVTPLDTTIEFKTGQNLFTISPFLRTYLEIDEPLYFYFDTRFDIGFGGQTRSIGDDKSDPIPISAFAVGIVPGFSFFMTDNVAVDLQFGYIGYTSVKTKLSALEGFSDSSDIEISAFQLTASLATINLGVTIMLNN